MKLTAVILMSVFSSVAAHAIETPWFGGEQFICDVAISERGPDVLGSKEGQPDSAYEIPMPIGIPNGAGKLLPNSGITVNKKCYLVNASPECRYSLATLAKGPENMPQFVHMIPTRSGRLSYLSGKVSTSGKNVNFTIDFESKNAAGKTLQATDTVAFRVGEETESEKTTVFGENEVKISIKCEKH